MATYKRGTRYGILSFARITSSITLSSFQSNPELTPTSNPIKNKMLWREDCSSIYLCPGDSFVYYIPLSTDNFDVDISGFNVVILNNQFQTVQTISTVTGVSYGSDKYYYISFTVPSIEFDNCVLAIINQADSNRLYYLSGYISFVSEDEDFPLFKWRNSYNHFGHFWEEVIDDNVNFYNQLRLDVSKINEQYEYEIEERKEALTGEILDITNDQDKYITIQTYQFTDEMHEGFSVLVGSDTLFINGLQFVKKTGYEIEAPDLLNLRKGSVDLYDLDYATANKAMSV